MDPVLIRTLVFIAPLARFLPVQEVLLVLLVPLAVFLLEERVPLRVGRAQLVDIQV